MSILMGLRTSIGRGVSTFWRTSGTRLATGLIRAILPVYGPVKTRSQGEVNYKHSYYQFHQHHSGCQDLSKVIVFKYEEFFYKCLPSVQWQLLNRAVSNPSGGQYATNARAECLWVWEADRPCQVSERGKPAGSMVTLTCYCELYMCILLHWYLQEFQDMC